MTQTSRPAGFWLYGSDAATLPVPVPAEPARTRRAYRWIDTAGTQHALPVQKSPGTRSTDTHFQFSPGHPPWTVFYRRKDQKRANMSKTSAVSSSLSLSTGRARFIIPTANTARAGPPPFLMQDAAGTTRETLPAWTSNPTGNTPQVVI